MDEPAARVTLITLGVADLVRSTAFYEALGFRRKAKSAEGVAFFEAGTVILSLWPTSELAKDAGVAVTRSGVSRRGAGVELCVGGGGRRSDGAGSGGRRAAILKRPGTVFWGGYTGYFTDPDKHIWEVAHNPGFPLSEDGRLMLPD